MLDLTDTCSECEAALDQRVHGVYRMGSCFGCRARSCARSMQAWRALRPGGDVEGLRAMLLDAFPRTQLLQARRAVWDWWQRDHSAGAGV